MIIHNLLDNSKKIPIKEKILFFFNNITNIFYILLVMWLVILIINIFLYQIGFGVTVKTSSITLFAFTYFAKIISIKLILTLIV